MRHHFNNYVVFFLWFNQAAFMVYCQESPICPPTKYIKDRQCTPCPVNYVCDGTLKKILCNVGYYRSPLDGEECIQCLEQKGQVCKVSGLSMWVRGCDGGKYFDESVEECVFNPAGYYTFDDKLQGESGPFNYHDRKSPIACTPGYYQDLQGSTSCQECGNGRISRTNVSLSCELCREGTYQPSLVSSSCMSCLPGSYNDEVQMSSCKQCIAGKFSEKNQSKKCEDCIGKGYNQFTNMTRCIECPFGKTSYYMSSGSALIMREQTFNVLPGNNNISLCRYCPIGYFTCECFSPNSLVDDLNICYKSNCNITAEGPVYPSCIPCGEGYYCPGNGTRIKLSMAEIGKTYILKTFEDKSQDNVVVHCTICNVSGEEFIFQDCTANVDRKCKKCSSIVSMKTFLLEKCSNVSDTVLGICNETRGDMLPGSKCNPCPGGTFFDSNWKECVLCPSNTFSNGNVSGCKPCESGKISVPGSIQCFYNCSTNMFSKSGKQNDCAYTLQSGITKLVAHCEAMQSSTMGGLPMDNTGASFLLAGNGGSPYYGYFWKMSKNGDCFLLNAPRQMGRISNIFQSQVDSPLIFFVVEEENKLHRMTLNNNNININFTIVSDQGYQMNSGIFQSKFDRNIYFIDGKTEDIIKIDMNMSSFEIILKGSSFFQYPVQMKETNSNSSSIAVLDNQGIWLWNYDFLNKNISGKDVIDKICCKNIINFWNNLEYKDITSPSFPSDIIVIFAFTVYNASSELKIMLIKNKTFLGEESTTILEPSINFDVDKFYLSMIPKGPILLNGFLSSSGIASKNHGIFISLSSKDSYGTQIHEIGVGKCLCNSPNLYCPAGIDQCVQVPTGYYTLSPWSNEIIPYSEGTIQGELCPLFHFTTKKPAATFCEPICKVGEIYDQKSKQCVNYCLNNEYFDKILGACSLCPLGTSGISNSRECVKCPAGKYGSANGVCSDCKIGSQTIFDGSTICMAISGKLNASSLCKADGVYDDDEKCSHRRRLFSGNSSHQEIIGLSATSKGSLFVSDGNNIFRYDKKESQWVSAFLNSQRSNYNSLAYENKIGLIQVSEDESTLYSAYPGSSCIFKISLIQQPMMLLEEWSGVCGSFGDNNGDRINGRFGMIKGLALMEGVEGKPSTLFVSTQSIYGLNCMSIRSVSVSDGSITTLFSFEQSLYPSFLLPSCITKSSMRMGIARGSDILYYSIENVIYSIKVFDYDTSNIPLVFMNSETPDDVFTSICPSPKRGYVTVSKTKNDNLISKKVSSNVIVSIPFSGINKRNMNEIVCAGQRIWYTSSMFNTTDIIEHYIQSENAADDIVYCAGGFTYSFVSKSCVQVGLGRYTSQEIDGSVKMCKSGTFNNQAGSSTHRDCYDCPLGTISEEGSISCGVCDNDDSGAFTYASGGSCIASCPIGSTIHPNHSRACKICEPGYTSNYPLYEKECTPCPAGKYSNGSTSGRCLDCPSGWTSPLGAFHCVKICESNQCGIDGETCSFTKDQWEVMTSINLAGSGYIISVVASRGNGIFFTDGNNLRYFLDTCSSITSVVESEGCSVNYTDFLPTICSSSRGISIACDRGLVGLAISHQYEDGLFASLKYLYVASFKFNCIYRLPIKYNSDRVQVQETLLFLDIANGGLDKWRFIGNKISGYLDSTFLNSQFNTISEIELSKNNQIIMISDFGNNKIRMANITSGTVKTILGRGFACTRSGISTQKTWNQSFYSLAGENDCLSGEASIKNPLGLGMSPDMRKLYIAINEESAVGSLRLNFLPKGDLFQFASTGAFLFDYECRMIYERMSQSLETCDISLIQSKSCFLQRAYDVAQFGNSLYVSVKNGITKIDLSSRICKQVSGKYWDVTQTSEGYVDGVYDTVTEQSYARFRQPYRIAVAEDTGIMYIADLENKAIRRFFINTQCQCPLGSKKLENHYTCYSSTQKWSDQVLMDCPQGEYAVEGESKCRKCTEALELGISIKTCDIWYLNVLRSGEVKYTYNRILNNPFPFGANKSDWYGTGANMPLHWDNIFRESSTTVYNLGKTEGRAPFGRDFVSLKYISERDVWIVENNPLYQPKLILPGFWYPCHSKPLTILDGSEGLKCSCPKIISAFESVSLLKSANEGQISWHNLRFGAFENGARALGTYKSEASLLKDYAISNSSYSLREMMYKDRINVWSKYVIFGSDQNAKNGACKGFSQGPCFPFFKHVSDEITYLNLSSEEITEFTFEKTDEWLLDGIKELKCGVGWPSHYSCPDGYTWVGPNSSTMTLSSKSLRNVQLEDQIACISCLAGTYSMMNEKTKQWKGGPYRCDQCMLGKYSSSVGSTECKLCPLGYYSNVFAATSCIKCPLENYWTEQIGSQSQLSCKPCRPGSGKCNVCAAGEYQSMAAQDMCLPCPPGHFSLEVNSSSCTPCPPNHFRDTPGGAACERCPLNTFSNLQRTSCVSCDGKGFECDLSVDGECGKGCGLNYYWDMITQTCSRCPLGYLNAYNPCAKEMAACFEGPTWKYVQWNPKNIPGQDTILDCSAGFKANEQRTGCVECGSGTYGKESAGCIPCPHGTFSNQSGLTSCFKCGIGKYSDRNGTLVCEDCSVGHFGPSEGATSCTQCTAGKYASSTQSVWCNLCSNGTYGTVNGSVSDCQEQCDVSANLFSGMGATVCTYCAGGVVQSASSSCVGCGLGSYEENGVCKTCSQGLVNLNTSFGKIEDCMRCSSLTAYALSSLVCAESPGGHVPNPIGNGYTPCVSGTYRTSDLKHCTLCNEGTYNRFLGQSECVPCDKGFFQNVKGKTSCSPCIGNSIANVSGSSVCLSCPLGTVSSNGSIVCSPCPSNTYQQGKVCLPCLEGTVSFPGSTLCRPCGPWTVYNANSKTCSECARGKFMTFTSIIEGGELTFYCESCPSGKHNPHYGMSVANHNISSICQPCGPNLIPSSDKSSCVPCSAGKYAPLNSNQCEDCLPGYFSSDGVICQPCPLGQYTNEYRSSKCNECPMGTFSGNSTGQVRCQLCEKGTFSNETGKSVCSTCAPSMGFSSRSGSMACSPRRTACELGQYILLHLETPWMDNECMFCQPCKSNEYTVAISMDSFGLVKLLDAYSQDELCPGNLPFPSYRCINSDPIAGQYIGTSNVVGSVNSDIVMESMLSNIRPMRCSDLDVYGTELVDYVKGPTYDCYVGCKYGTIPNVGMAYYTSQFVAGLNEVIDQNIFYPRMVTVASNVCKNCSSSLDSCPLGKYRPKFGEGCGPPCGLPTHKDICYENDGCYMNCNNLSDGAVFVGGSPILGGASNCPWVCTRGYFTENSSCVLCNSSNICGEGFMMVSLDLCLPYHTKKEVCKACPSVVGGKAISWNNSTQKCIYRCNKGYYPNNDYSFCESCDTTTPRREKCGKGFYRDVESCAKFGIEPECKACESSEKYEHISFTSDGGISQYNCSAICKVGLHTTKRGVTPTVYIDYLSNQYTSSMNITCVPCQPSDNIACHGICPAKHYRNRSVVMDTTPGACVMCKQNYECKAGYFAPECSGNETMDVDCVACNQSALYNSKGEKNRVYIPNEYAMKVDLGKRIIYTKDKFLCPTMCSVNFAQDPKDFSNCITCQEITKMYPDSEFKNSNPLEPSPMNFVFSHWNATPATIWWNIKTSTPLYLKSVITTKLDALVVDRRGICWACPLGRGTQSNDPDLCLPLAGYTSPEALKFNTEKVPIPVDGKIFEITYLREPRPLPPTLLNFIQGNNYMGRRRLFSVMNATQNLTNSSFNQNISSELTLFNEEELKSKNHLLLCPYGWFKENGMDSYCVSCPQGTSTVNRGSTSVLQCFCFPGWKRINRNDIKTINGVRKMDGPCIPCSVDTYRPLYGVSEDICLPCGPNETTYGRMNATKCSCKVGFTRKNNSCIPCPAGFFCRPCYDDLRIKCSSPSGMLMIPCFSGSTSPPGSSSIENCSCVGNGFVKLKRSNSLNIDGIHQSIVQYESNPSEFFYCFPIPPHAIFDEITNIVSCKKGWKEVWSIQPKILQGCVLCEVGSYANKDPSGTELFQSNGLSIEFTCLPCPKGTYSTSRDMIGNCTSCPLTQTTREKGSSKLEACGCPASQTKRSSDGVCVGCLPTQYISEITKACTDCPPFSMLSGDYVNKECKCMPGYTLPMMFSGSGTISSSGCVPCPKNAYSSKASNMQCTPCPAGSLTAGVGSKSIRDCGASATLCSPGYTYKANFGCILSNLLI